MEGVTGLMDESRMRQFNVFLSAPLVIVIRRQIVYATAFIAAWGYLLHLENYLMSAARKMSYSNLGMLVLPIAGMFFELFTAYIFAVLCNSTFQMMDKIGLSCNRKDDLVYDAFNWYTLYGAITVYPIIYLLLLICSIGGEAGALFGGASFLASALLGLYCYFRYGLAGCIVSVVCWWVSRFIVSGIWLLAAKILHSLGGVFN